MALILTLDSQNPMAMPREASRTVGQASFSIGRGYDNDWVLPDPNRHVSKQHCIIALRNGDYTITDTSTNGVYVNHADAPLGRGNTAVLHDGDVLRFGDYTITAWVGQGMAGATMLPDDPLAAAADPFAQPADPFAQADPFAAPPGHPALEQVERDPLEDLDPFGTGSHEVAGDPFGTSHHGPGDPLAGPPGGLDGGGNIIPDDPGLFDDLTGGHPQWEGPSRPDRAPLGEEYFEPPKVSHGHIPDDWDAAPDTADAADPVAEDPFASDPFAGADRPPAPPPVTGGGHIPDDWDTVPEPEPEDPFAADRPASSRCPSSRSSPRRSSPAAAR